MMRFGYFTQLDPLEDITSFVQAQVGISQRAEIDKLLERAYAYIGITICVLEDLDELIEEQEAELEFAVAELEKKRAKAKRARRKARLAMHRSDCYQKKGLKEHARRYRSLALRSSAKDRVATESLRKSIADIETRREYLAKSHEARLHGMADYEAYLQKYEQLSAYYQAEAPELIEAFEEFFCHSGNQLLIYQ